MDKNGQFTAVGSYELPSGYIKGSVGAGDAFCAGTLYGLYSGWNAPEILKFANGAAACCLSRENSFDGMRPADEIRNLNYPTRKV
jgi:sugar/nucleoside kinase (ribokinase family)